MLKNRTCLTKLPIVRMAILSASVSFSYGCAPIVSGTMNATLTEEDVQVKTAEYFGVRQSDLRISNLQKNTLDTTYKTRVYGKLYNCNVYYGAVNCSIPGGYSGPSDNSDAQSNSASTYPESKNKELILSIQTELSRRGFYSGSVDGIYGPRTKAAITDFQKRSGLPQDGHPTKKLLEQMDAATGVAGGQDTSEGNPLSDFSGAVFGFFSGESPENECFARERERAFKDGLNPQQADARVKERCN